MSLAPETRYSLLRRICDPADEASWQEFWRLYDPVVYRMARRFGLQDADAKDLTQDVMTAVLDAVQHWEPDEKRGRFRTWLYAVVRNKTISAMRCRRPGTRGTGETGMLQRLAAVPATEAFDDEVRRAAFHQAAEIVRQQVQPATWNAFWQTSVLGQSVEDAAQALRLSIGSVYAARSRVVARLRHEIEIILGEDQ